MQFSFLQTSVDLSGMDSQNLGFGTKAQTRDWGKKNRTDVLPYSSKSIASREIFHF